MRRMDVLFAALFAAALHAPARAQEVTLHGQVRPRFEFRDPASAGGRSFTSMRVRGTLSAALERDVSVVVQVQDVRLWGEETNTLNDFSADNFDLHQGFMDLGTLESANVAVRVGRQELNLGGQRLVGAVGWTQQGRSFDGGRVRFNGARGSLDLIGFKTLENAAPNVDSDSEVFGAYATLEAGESRALDLYGFYLRARALTNTDQATLGARLVGTRGGVSYRAEASLQVGERAGRDVSAFMLGGRVGFTVGQGGRGRVTLWYDHLSGDDDPLDGDIGVFDTMFATNHKFYGLADLFLNIPAHTAGLGLQDMAIKGSLQARDDLTLGADLHSFRLAKRGTISSTHLGEELDLTLTHRYAPGVSIVGGLSFVVQDDPFAEIGRLGENLTWGYLMLNATF